MKHPTQEDIIRYNQVESHKVRQYKDSMRATAIGWIGIIVSVIMMLLLATCQPATAQTVYEVQYESQANVKLYKVYFVC